MMKACFPLPCHAKSHEILSCIRFLCWAGLLLSADGTGRRAFFEQICISHAAGCCRPLKTPSWGSLRMLVKGCTTFQDLMLVPVPLVFESAGAAVFRRC